MTDADGPGTEEATGGVEHTPEEIAAFNERVETIDGFTHLLRADLDVASQELRVEEDEEALERGHWKVRRLINLLITLLVALVLVVAAFYLTGTDYTALLGGGKGPERAADPAPESRGAASDESVTDGRVSGTWRVYFDDTRALPVFDLTFQPSGPATYLPQAEGPVVSVDSWEYTENGDAVEVALKLRTVDVRYGVDFTTDAWLRLTRDGRAMRGAYEQHIIGYETEGDAPGTLHDNGIQAVAESLYAEPTVPARE
jgi:hypothetical protein